MSGNKAQTRVAIMAATEQNQSHLSTLLGEAGLNVVLHEVAGEDFIRQLEQTSVDVLLVDLCEDTESQVDVIDILLEYDTLPVFFNDSSKAGGETNSMWAKKLARKLEKMARDSGKNNGQDLELEPEFQQPVVEKEATQGFENGVERRVEQENEGDTALELMPDLDDQISNEPVVVDQRAFSQEKENFSHLEVEISEKIESLQEKNEGVLAEVKEKPAVVDIPNGAAVNVWVLGASLGGPQAVRQFLMAIKEDLPVAFILAQHIGENHITLLGEQLDRVSKFKVFPAYNGHMIRHHEVILTPAGKNIHITEDGYISLSSQEADAIYSPCINDVMAAVAKRYGNMAGTIVFSGMGDDGAIGCQSMADQGGIVWAQDVESCVISSMPDQARMTNKVTFSANPRRLADELYKYYKEEH